MVFSKRMKIKSTKRLQEIEITDAVKSVIKDSKIKEGIVLIFTGNTTGGIYLGNIDKYLPYDIERYFEEGVQNKPTFMHNKYGGKNASAHIKNLLIGSNVCIPLTDGSIELGKWQGIYYAELDGPREREYIIKIVGE